MKNRLLSITRGSIPYIKELRAMCGSVTACLLMQQLDYWFEKRPDGFYKFKSKCNAAAYKAGDSWCEELGFSEEEFTSAFAKIGIVYKSKTDFSAAEEMFIRGNSEMFYCSYFDRQTGETWYFRNHDLVDEYLNSLSKTNVVVNRESRFTGSKGNLQETEKVGFCKPRKSVSSPIYTENTTENTEQEENAPEKIEIKSASKDAIIESKTATTKPNDKATLLAQTNKEFRMIETPEELTDITEKVIELYAESLKKDFERRGFVIANKRDYAIEFSNQFFKTFQMCSLQDTAIRRKLSEWAYIFAKVNTEIAQAQKAVNLLAPPQYKQPQSTAPINKNANLLSMLD